MEVEFSINDIKYKENSATISISTSLNTFIRDHAQLKGTKFMCLEGGCGACVVTARGQHPVTKETRNWAVNSCLAPVFSCHNWEITTVEGIGDKVKGYHPIQSRLAKLNGTQCGYCSPGMVMNMYSLLEDKNGSVSMAEIENSFGGNICRCTGYRPILDAFKSLACDASQEYKDMLNDIEDLKICPKSGQHCSGGCQSSPSVRRDLIKIVFDDNGTWIKVFDLKELFVAIASVNKSEFMLVAGNTAHGVYRRNPNIKSFIDVNDVTELRSHSVGDELIVGGTVNLSELMDILNKAASANTKFSYANRLVKHIDLIANVPVRNSGTIAGNLSIKHQHNEFPSDMFLMLEAVGAKLTIADSATSNAASSLQDFLKIDMKNKVILNVILPQIDDTKFLFRSYKIMPRAQNAHAFINAGFLVELSGEKVVSARICFGGINPGFVHASKTEKSLNNKDLFTTETLQAAVASLSEELNPDWELPDASPEYRKNLAISLFYKFILDTCPDTKVKKEFKSGGEILLRELSSGRQTFDTIEKNWPLTKPIKKLESLVQVSGEAQYVNDFPKQHNEVFAAFVVATEALTTIGAIDAKDALKLPGVVAFYSAKDIPGTNSFVVKNMFFPEDEEIFVNDVVKFYGQPVGMIVAETTELALHAASLVKITYINNDKKPLVTLKDAVAELSCESRVSAEPTQTNGYFESFYNMIFPTETKEITGSFAIGGQYHFFMETIQAVCVPAEDGMDIYSTTQWMDLVQVAVANCLKVPVNSINVIVRRLGGGYGGKISRSSSVACAAALAAKLLNRPVRFILTIEANMNIFGKRYGCMNDYTVEVDNNGKIQKMKNTYNEDGGCSMNEQVTQSTDELFHNCYDHSGWVSSGKTVKTDAPSNTWCRAPGTTEGLAMIENIIEHIGYDLNLSPLAVRLANVESDGIMKKIIEDFVADVEYDKRLKAVDTFNAENRWRKRGIAIVPMKYPQEYFGNLPATVAIYQGDGSVAVTHGGIEMGQGINTKVAQVAAFTLGVPLESVIIRPSSTNAAPNAIVTGGSMTSEAVSYAVMKACETLRTRIDVVRKDMKDAPWKDVVAKCYEKYIDLSASFMYNVTQLKTYNTFGVSCAEVELDILTGNLLLNRVDILEDTGESLSPLVDVGQVEGAFIMGIGYWLTEKLVYHRTSGELLTNRTWNYKPPGAKDIPIDFRVKFLQKSSNPNGVLRSKATGEPATCMSIVAYFAVKHALKSARKDAGLGEGWFELPTPATPEEIFLAAGNAVSKYEL